MSMKFQLLIQSKMMKKCIFLAFKLSDVFIMHINIKMPAIVGILTFMSMSSVELSRKSFITSRPDLSPGCLQS